MTTDDKSDLIEDIEAFENNDGDETTYTFDEEGRFVRTDFSERFEDDEDLDEDELVQAYEQSNEQVVEQVDNGQKVDDKVQTTVESTSDTHEVLSAEIIEPEHIEGDFIAEKRKIVYKLKDYEGPIELLYDLIKAAKIPIEDIFISDITSQYVAIIRETPKEELDYDYAGDFISMAADLIYLKSERTLPRDEDEEGNGDGIDEREQLINKIKQYALIREESEKLKEMETINRFYRPPTYTEKDYRVALVNFSLPKLVEAFAKVLATADKRKQEVIPKKVMKDRFSVHDQMVYITTMISVRREMKFTELFEPDYDKSDIVTTFLAVLELLKYGRLRAVQEEVFGEINIFAIDGMEDLPIEFEEGDDGKY